MLPLSPNFVNKRNMYYSIFIQFYQIKILLHYSLISQNFLGINNNYLFVSTEINVNIINVNIWSNVQ